MLNVAIIVSMEVTLKGKAKYGWPPGSVPFHIENIIYLFKKSTLMRRSNVLSFPPKLVFPAVNGMTN